MSFPLASLLTINSLRYPLNPRLWAQMKPKIVPCSSQTNASPFAAWIALRRISLGHFSFQNPGSDRMSCTILGMSDSEAV